MVLLWLQMMRVGYAPLFDLQAGGGYSEPYIVAVPVCQRRSMSASSASAMFAAILPQGSGVCHEESDTSIQIVCGTQPVRLPLVEDGWRASTREDTQLSAIRRAATGAAQFVQRGGEHCRRGNNEVNAVQPCGQWYHHLAPPSRRRRKRLTVKHGTSWARPGVFPTTYSM